MNKMKLALAAGILALSAGMAAASPVYTHTGNAQGVNVTIKNWPVSKPINGNTVYAGSFNVKDDATPANNFAAWCLDLAKTIAVGDTFKETSTPYNSNALSQVQQDRVQGLFDAHFETAKSNANSAAAFQLALWEAIYDNTFNLSKGSFAVQGVSSTITGLAQGFLNSFTAGSQDNYVVSYLQNDRSKGQDIVTASPIPLPAAAWLLIGGLGALAAVRRRRDTEA